MKTSISSRRRALLTGAAAPAIALALWTGQAAAQEQAKTFAIAPQPLAEALLQFSRQANVDIVASAELTRGRTAPQVSGDMTSGEALDLLLVGTGLTAVQSGDAYVISRVAPGPQSGSAAGDGAEVEALIVTAQKREEDIQDVPIAISAFTQEALERSQVAGGPDLMTQVPNMTFTKTNFSSYSIQIRGIGTQAISATTDAAVAVAFNNTPFIRNRFFEQEFYDLQRVEVLRGPQGTLYGRNATAGVVNLISQKPKLGTYEAKVSGDIANYNSTRLEGLVNVPLADDKVALRLAGAWTKREGYSTNEITGNPIDGRDLWSTRLSLRLAPTDAIDATLIWEHFEEDDDRLRSGKQLCHQDDREEIGGYSNSNANPGGNYALPYSQGCIPASLYAPESFEAPNGFSLPYYHPLKILNLPVMPGFNPYASLAQSRDLRVIESTVDPEYRAKTDVVELQLSADITENLAVASETAYSYDQIFSLQDFNRFNTARGAFDNQVGNGYRQVITPGEFGGIFCDPQVGCADRLVAVDLSTARSRHFSQEFRLSSDFEGPFNFSLGANFLRYDTHEKYYVFINTLTMIAGVGGYGINGVGILPPYVGGVTDNQECLVDGGLLPNPREPQVVSGCIYIDPNPIGSLNDLGHNYFLSKNPYKLVSYAVFGEAYYNLTEQLKLTAGLRWTVDRKEAPRIPSWVLASDTLGYPVLEVSKQDWREPTGRLAIDWKPDLAFTDETLLYASYARGYKAGGSNPPPSGVVAWGLPGQPNPVGEAVYDQSVTKPKVFQPEFVDAFELGAKNTLLDGRLVLNASAFYYDYTDYQISQIIDRSAVNYNFDAQIWGLEIEADWRPVENLKLGFKGGYENTRVADGARAIDVMNRTAGRTDWIVVRPFPTFPSNCVLPLYTQVFAGGLGTGTFLFNSGQMGPCEVAYAQGLDPVTALPYVPNPTTSAYFGHVGLIGYEGYVGHDPTVDVGQNNGEGFFTDLSGNELPNAPHLTATVTADYTLPLPQDWLMTLHTDLYYQSEAWTRIFNMEGYDKLKAYTNVNLAAIFQNEDLGWKLMAYVKNVFDRDSITGAFLNSDDTGLTTNVFLTEPRLYGLRVTKEFSGGPWWTGANPDHTGTYPLTVELGGSLLRHDAPFAPLRSHADYSGDVDPARFQNLEMDRGEGSSIRLTWAPAASPWSVSGAYRRGSAKVVNKIHDRQLAENRCILGPPYQAVCEAKYDQGTYHSVYNWMRGEVRTHDEYEFIDFEVGRDFGIGGIKSRVSAGVRYADFASRTELDVVGTPDVEMPDEWALFKYTTKHFYDTDLKMNRKFEGLGPVLTWDASKSLWGDQTSGRLNVDLSLSGGVLFGKQKAQASGSETSTYYRYIAYHKEAFPKQGTTTFGPRAEDRSESVTVPTYAATLGLSYDVGRIKIGTGYRWERFSDVLDGGYSEHQSYDRTTDGPYFKLSVGFGG